MFPWTEVGERRPCAFSSLSGTLREARAESSQDGSWSPDNSVWGQLCSVRGPSSERWEDLSQVPVGQ